jgi:ribosomal protein S18 acetylase RimI-like enzyme
MNGLIFHPAIEFDYAFLAEAFNRSFEGYAVPFQFDARALEQRARPESWDLATSFVSLRDGQLAGILCTARRGASCRVAAMGVTASVRGQGVGRAMMRHCVAEAQQRGDTELLLEVIESNTPAVRLYESMGLKSQRRLVGFECPKPPPGNHAPGLAEIDSADFAAVAQAEYEPRLPWQMRPETLANLTLPVRAFTLDDRAFALLGDPAAPRVGIRGFAVRRADRRQRLGTNLVHALFAKFPGRTWGVSPIVPEGLADGFFRANGFVASALAQREMRMPLTPPA